MLQHAGGRSVITRLLKRTHTYTSSRDPNTAIGHNCSSSWFLFSSGMLRTPKHLKKNINIARLDAKSCISTSVEQVTISSSSLWYKLHFGCLNADMKMGLRVVHCHVGAASSIFTQSQWIRNKLQGCFYSVYDNTRRERERERKEWKGREVNQKSVRFATLH